MKNYQTSDYAVNKNAEGIVYRFADQTVEVTLADYLRENPDRTAADFAELKALSDEDYYETDRRSYRQTWKDTSFETLDEDEMFVFAVPSAEDGIFGQREQAEAYANKQSIASLALDKLTEVQRRRYLLYHVKGMTVREVADAENAHFTSVSESIKAAENRIKKFLSKKG